MKKDISNRVDIEFLVDAFYKQIKSDDHIGFFFTEIISLEWENHLPIICDFWEGVLLDGKKYQGNAMIKHINLSRKSKISPAHFETWLSIWQQKIQENFSGEMANQASQKARQIAALMQYKIAQDFNQPEE